MKGMPRVKVGNSISPFLGILWPLLTTQALRLISYWKVENVDCESYTAVLAAEEKKRVMRQGVRSESRASPGLVVAPVRSDVFDWAASFWKSPQYLLFGGPLSWILIACLTDQLASGTSLCASPGLVSRPVIAWMAAH